EDEELFQFAPEEVAPPGKVEGERRERSGDREAPGMLPIDGLDPDDADDDLLGDTVARAGAGDGRFVLEPETQARTDSGSVDEALTLVIRGTKRRLRGRRISELELRRDRMEGGEELEQLGGGEAMLVGEPVHESLDLGLESEGFVPGARTGDRAAVDENGGR